MATKPAGSEIFWAWDNIQITSLIK
jgi:hypothetical protein